METPWLYLLVNLGTILFPFLLSFDKKVAYYRSWSKLFPAIGLTMAFFLLWDYAFTYYGVWGFDPAYYLTTLRLGLLPLEEWLFFLTVPYSCVFIYACAKAYLPAHTLQAAVRPLSLLLVSGMLGIGIVHFDKAYTAFTFIASAALLAYHYFVRKSSFLGLFFVAYLICCLPFVLVNGILTGYLTAAPVVWYNDAHNLSSVLGSRLGTIPYDDFAYGFLLILMNVTFYEYFHHKGRNKEVSPVV